MARPTPPDLLQGTVDLLILRTLQSEPMHGWAISERIQQISQDVLQVNQGSLYPALHRLEHQGWIEAEWGISELGRRAKFYRLTAIGPPAARRRGQRVGTHDDRHRPRDEDGVNLRDVRLRIRALFAPRRVEREMDEELRFHLEMETRKHLAAGLSADEARARAQARFGSTAVAADACRDARGLSLLDATVGDVLYALRTFRRSPMVAATIVGTVALGLGLVAAVFTIFNAFVFRPDAVRDPDSLFSLRWALSGNATAHVRFTLPRYQSLRGETDIFSGVCARLADITSRIDGRMMEGQLVTGNFFEVVGVNTVLGRPLMPEDDVRGAGRPVMVLSHSGWSRLFDSDPGVVGRSVSVSGFQYQIVGVAAEGFRGLGVLPPDYFAPLSLVGQFRPWFAGREDMVAIEVLGRLKPGLSRATAHAGLAVWAANGNPVDARPALTLDPRGTATPLSPGVLLAFSPLFVAFGLILMIGCANVANLLLARAVARQREIGIRLSLGASRRRVVRQLLTESLLLALVSAVGALVISRVVLDASVSTLMRTVPPEFAELLRFDAPATDWRVAAFLIVAAIISTAFFGLVPALYGTRIDLVRTIRGEFGRDARPGRARNALIVVQVTASALLLICAGIFLRSALRSASTDPGLRTADTVVIDIVNEPFRAAMVAAVAASPSVAEVSASWPEALNRPRDAFVRATEEVQGNTARFPVGYRLASPEYFSVLAIDVLRGRIYSESEARSHAAVALVSESTARRLWPKGDAVGQAFSLDSDRTLTQAGRTTPRCHRGRSASSASSATWPAFAWRDTRKPACMSPRVPRLPKRI